MEQGKQANVTKFNGYGDVIIYKPNGMTSVHPIIHRAGGVCHDYRSLKPIYVVTRKKQVESQSRRSRNGSITLGRQQPLPRSSSLLPRGLVCVSR